MAEGERRRFGVAEGWGSCVVTPRRPTAQIRSEREMAEGEKRSFGVAGGGLVVAKKAHRTDQIKELRERERHWSKSCSFFCSFFFF